MGKTEMYRGCPILSAVFFFSDFSFPSACWRRTDYATGRKFYSPLKTLHDAVAFAALPSMRNGDGDVMDRQQGAKGVKLKGVKVGLGARDPL